MAFSKPVPSQEQAAEYLKMIADKYPGSILVGGHSKGGNLAMYAAAQAEDTVSERIRTVFNYDGPGLSDKMDASALYARICGRLRSFVPQGSIVGMLLAHPDQYTVVKSNSIGVFQHDPYSWQVDGPLFKRKENLAEDSVRFDIAFRQWLSGISEEQREELVEALFGILSATKADAFNRDFWIRLAQNSKEVKAAIEQVSPDTKSRILALFAELAKPAIQPVRDIIEKAMNAVEAMKR